MRKRHFTLTVLFFLLCTSFGLLAVDKASGAALPKPALAPTVIPKDYRWDLDSIYKDAAAWESDFKTVKETYIPKYKDYQGKLGNADKLLELYNMNEKAGRLTDKLYVYAHMKRDEDQSSSAYSEMSVRVEGLSADLGSAAAYIRPELLALPETDLEGFKKDPRFSQYIHSFDELIRQKAHTLSADEEKLLAMASEIAGAPQNIATKIREADLQFPTIKDSNGEDIELSETQYNLMLNKPERELRKKAYEGIMGAYNNSKYSLAVALDAQMRSDIFYARARKYDNALEASLGANNIPVEVYENLLKATDNNIDSLHKYVTLRKKVLNLDKVHIYDLFASLVAASERSFTYDESRQILNKALEPLGSDYIKVMKGGFDNRWVDVFPSENKTSGAYNWGSYDTHPYILLNFDGTIDSLQTIGHEMGHAMNSYYTNKEQPYHYSSISTFNAEVASTTNETFLLNYLIDNAKDDTERLFYLDKQAETITGTFFRQVMYAGFEKDIHERVEAGEALSVDSLNEMWGKQLAKFYGPDFEVDELAKSGWLRVPHFYYNFYVYQYATGIAASNQFVKNISENKPGALEAYLKYLADGGSDYPVEVLRKAGVDMTTGEPVDNLLAKFANILQQMQAIMAKQDSKATTATVTATRTKTVTSTITPTQTRTLTTTPTPTTTSTPIPCNQARFIQDVNYPDGSELQPDASFVKTWLIKNTGSCTWDSGYQLIFASGDQMGAPASLPLTSGAVAPGKSANVSVNLVAPKDKGTYTGNFRFRAGDGTLFGIENSQSGNIWVKIIVPPPTPVPEPPTSTPTPTNPPPEVKKPDLIVSEIKLNPANPVADEVVNIRVYTYNQGNAPASQFTLKWWGLDSFAEPSCTWDVTDTISSNGGRGYDCTFTFTSWYAPNQTTKAVVDTSNHVDESDETNNIKTQPITVQKP